MASGWTHSLSLKEGEPGLQTEGSHRVRSEPRKNRFINQDCCLWIIEQGRYWKAKFFGGDNSERQNKSPFFALWVFCEFWSNRDPTICDQSEEFVDGRQQMRTFMILSGRPFLHRTCNYVSRGVSEPANNWRDMVYNESSRRLDVPSSIRRSRL